MNEIVSQKITQLNTDRVTGIANLRQKGVSTDSTYGFSQIVSKILEIPSDKLTGVLVDNEVSYRKQVPPNSAGVCYLNSIGGMTYKGFTFDCTVVEDGGTLCAPYSFTFPKEFTLPDDASGQWAFEPVVVGFTNGVIGDLPMDYSLSGKNMSGSGICSGNVTVGTQLRCIPRFVDTDSYAPNYRYYYPPDCFTDLRDAKPTAVVSYGANLIPFPYHFNRSGFGEMDVGFTKEWAGLTFTINADRSISVKGTATGTPSFVLGEYLDFPNEDMYLSANMVGTFDGRAYVYTVDENGTYYSTDASAAGWVKLPKEHEFSWVGVQVTVGTTVDATFYPMLNTGVSPLPYSPYFEKTYKLPDAITNKLGKGYDATLFNEYNFVDKKAVERVNSTVLSGTVERFDIVASRDRVGFKLPTDTLTIETEQYEKKANLKTPYFDNEYGMYDLNIASSLIYQVGGMVYSGIQHAWFFTPLNLWGSKDSAQAWFASAQIPIVYELANDVRTAIPTSFDPLIKVEAGGYLEFVNDYGYPVPSTVTFSTINGGGTT